MLRVIRNVVIVMLAGATVFAAQAKDKRSSAEPQAAASPGAYAIPRAPGRLVDVGGGRQLHILCKGRKSGPTVIFEAGLSQYTAHSTYGTAQDAIAPFARVCTYDRAGLGWSDPAPANWTQAGMVADLHTLLAAAHEMRPYVIVGHSLGGLLARTYVHTYPHDVAGLVLLDATSDEDFAELATADAAIVPKLDAAIAASKPGVPVVTLPIGTAPEMQMAFTPKILRGVRTEFKALERLPASMKRPGGFGKLGELPLIVVRRGKTAQPPSADDLHHQQVQERLAKLSTDSILIVAKDSGHNIALDQPNLVADAVQRMLQALRNDTHLTQSAGDSVPQAVKDNG